MSGRSCLAWILVIAPGIKDEHPTNLPATRIEADEIWGFVSMKARSRCSS